MSNQKAPSRPWFSFSSLTRLVPTPPAPAPTPAPAPQPRASLARPTLRPVAQPQGSTSLAKARNAGAPQATQPAPASTAPATQVPQEPVRAASNPPRVSAPTPRANAPPAALYPNSLEQKSQPSNKVSAPAASTTSSNATARVEVPLRAAPAANITTRSLVARAVTPTSSQSNTLSQPTKTMTASEKPKIPAVSEDKNVISQRTIDMPKPHKNSEKTHKSKGYVAKLSGFEEDDHRRKAVTIAGENKGAVMEVHPSKKHGYAGHSLFHKNKNNDSNSDGSASESSNNGSSNTKKKDKKSNKMRSLPIRAFMNSNVQGINNSIVYDTSFNHHDPGIHLGLTKNPSNSGYHIKGSSNS